MKMISKTYWFRLTIIAIPLVFLIFWYFSLPRHLFSDPYSTVILDRNGKLLNASVATDGQWRFPVTRDIPELYYQSVLSFEDRYFEYHPGVNPVAVFRAMWQNIKSGEIKSGASTLSMQVIRLSRKNKGRTILEKITEIFLATRLELRYSKAEIFSLYTSHAPFGGNVVGLPAASWRYYGRSHEELSWAESATLAVLPNSPSLIFPGRNQSVLLAKRNRLLHRLANHGHIDSISLQLALAEPLPGAPKPIPQHTPQLFTRVLADGLAGAVVHASIDAVVQARVSGVMALNHNYWFDNQVQNMAVLVAEVTSGQVLAYCGNAPDTERKVTARNVDIINSLRSPGSLLKPLLYAGMLQDGKALPTMLVADIPTFLGGFSPENYTRSYDGAVEAWMALARSLNIPAVRMLMDYNPGKFLELIKASGITTFNKPASHYGLSMILGGGEVTMWETAGVFASMARTLNNYRSDTIYDADTFFPLSYQFSTDTRTVQKFSSPFPAGIIWHTFKAMEEAARPDTQANWHRFASSGTVAWKTGTSFGNRDAWAIGVTPEYVVAVWVGNATGEGRPNLTGIAAAAPILFDVISTLPSSGWFQTPYDELKPLVVCSKSGYPAGGSCDEVDTLLVADVPVQIGQCPYHQAITIENISGLRVNSSCASLSETHIENWFVLPPAMEYYFKQKNPFYKPLPAVKEDCYDLFTSQKPMQWIYPSDGQIIYIPVQLDGSDGEVIFRIAHSINNTAIHWYVNKEFIGTTRQFHEMAASPAAGSNVLTAIDEFGNILEKKVEIRRKDNKS